MANRLAKESSPYLLQHAENPVDWYPWGEMALDKARSENRPIFLSIGYSSCYWCHVMACETFEDEAVAALLNEHFVSIKVDREERPDLDQVYMAAVQAMTGRGGWPMSVFLLPDGRPFYGGTYFPPTSRHGIPSFTEVLHAIIDAWNNRREEVEEQSRTLVETLRRDTGPGRLPQDDEPLRHDTLDRAAQKLAAGYDAANGGWGPAPKFPHPMTIEFLLRRHYSTGDAEAERMAVDTLSAIARGGIYDQIGGGFHRYSVDAFWRVPHFEKMLYDNAGLARVYLHAWQATGEDLFRVVAEETLDYVLREMTHPAGGFYSSQDADTEGEEGRYYLWTAGEIRDLLGDEAEPFMEAYGVTEEGNFEGRNVLIFGGTPEEREALADARQKLLEAREQRVRPGRDEKVLTSWNGLMLSAMADAARALHRDDYLAAARHCAAFMLEEVRRGEGRLRHTWKAGRAHIEGFLDDYTHLMEGLLALYQADYDPQWFAAAQEMAEEIMLHFRAPVGFYDTGDDHEQLIVRPMELQDNAMPSGNSMAAKVLLHLANMALDSHYARPAEQVLRAMQPFMARYPTSFGQWLVALSDALSRHQEIAIVGEPDAGDTADLIEVCVSGYHPYRTVAVGDPESAGLVVPLLQGRERLDDTATAYVCTGFTCHPPVTEPNALAELLV
jgi:uncharacterized protein YyaL (SSP411 family)